MKWNKITSENDLTKIISESKNKPVLIFKHSTRCSISSMALNRLEREWEASSENLITPHYLDLINFRELSNLISEKFNVIHESPQIIVIEEGNAIHDASHMNINLKEIISKVS